jgi:chromosome segregation ATPase
MPIEQLTYAQIAERLGITADAARAIVQRHRLPRARANDSNKMLVTIDLTDIRHKPRGRSSPDQEAAVTDPVAPLLARIAELEAELERRSGDHLARIAELQAELEKCSGDHRAHVAELEAELARAEQRSHDHRSDYERERVRADCLVVHQDRLLGEIEKLRSLELGACALLQASQMEQVQDKLAAELETVRTLLQAAQPPLEPNVRPMITRPGERLTRSFRTALQSVRAMF